MNEYHKNIGPKKDRDGIEIAGSRCTWVTGTIKAISANPNYTRSKTDENGVVTVFKTKEERMERGTPFLSAIITISNGVETDEIDANVWQASVEANDLTFREGGTCAVHFDLDGAHANVCWLGLTPKRGVRASFFDAVMAPAEQPVAEGINLPA